MVRMPGILSCWTRYHKITNERDERAKLEKKICTDPQMQGEATK